MQLCIFVVSYILCFHVIAVVTTKLQQKQKLSPLQIQTIAFELPALERTNVLERSWKKTLCWKLKTMKTTQKITTSL